MRNSSTSNPSVIFPINKNKTSGIIFAFKKEGITSQQLVATYKRKYNFKKIGHAGTLDPFATGLVILLINKATSLQDYFMSMKKKYNGTILLGKKTDTLDPTGEVIVQQKINPFTKEQCQQIIQKYFSGEIEQTPPRFSAIKINGKRAYSLARNKIDFEIKSRKIFIYSFEINYITKNKINFTVECSKGTYIRSLADDFAKKIDNICYLESLHRVSIGNFKVQKETHSKEEINSIDTIVLGIKINLTEREFHDSLNGKISFTFADGYNKLYYQNQLFQIFLKKGKEIKKVFHENFS